MLCTGLYMVLKIITSMYGQWNSILVVYTCGSPGILPSALSMLCQQNPTMG